MTAGSELTGSVWSRAEAGVLFGGDEDVSSWENVPKVAENWKTLRVVATKVGFRTIQDTGSSIPIVGEGYGTYVLF